MNISALFLCHTNLVQDDVSILCNLVRYQVLVNSCEPLFPVRLVLWIILTSLALHIHQPARETSTILDSWKCHGISPQFSNNARRINESQDLPLQRWCMDQHGWWHANRLPWPYLELFGCPAHRKSRTLPSLESDSPSWSSRKHYWTRALWTFPRYQSTNPATVSGSTICVAAC